MKNRLGHIADDIAKRILNGELGELGELGALADRACIGGGIQDGAELYS